MAGRASEYRGYCIRNKISRMALNFMRIDGKVSAGMQKSVDSLNDGTDVGFGASTADSRPARFLGQLLGQVNRHHQDWDLREQIRDLLGHVEAIQIGHLEVEQNHVRRILLYPLQGFASGSGLVADMPGGLLLEEIAQIVSNRRIVVNYENANQVPRLPEQMINLAACTTSF
jgi:hypothetical protein